MISATRSDNQQFRETIFFADRHHIKYIEILPLHISSFSLDTFNIIFVFLADTILVVQYFTINLARLHAVNNISRH